MSEKVISIEEGRLQRSKRDLLQAAQSLAESAAKLKEAQVNLLEIIEKLKDE